ncbi:MAG: 30S ribosomal protein S1, partial [Planctomycetota bacterium]
ELELGPNEKLDDHYHVGDKIRAQVIKLDELERKIGLSNKNLPPPESSPSGPAANEPGPSSAS